MSDLSRNLRAMQAATVALNTQTREGRNDALRDYYRHLSPEIRQGLTFLHGSATYRDKVLEDFLRLINKRPVHLPIQFVGGDDNQLLANAAADMYNMAYLRAAPIADTGAHLHSLTMFAREVGTSRYALIQDSPNVSAMPERTIVSLVAVIEYASTLEYRGMVGGILYHVANKMRGKYGSQLSVRFDYVSGKTLAGLGPGERLGRGRSGGTFPRIQIAHYGNLRRGFTRPGRTAQGPGPLRTVRRNRRRNG